MLLWIVARRFRCVAAHCRREIFAERFPDSVPPPRSRRTARLECIVHQLGLALGGRPGASFAGRLMLPVSNDTLLRVVRRHACRPAEPPRVVGVDDWAFRRNHRYGSIVCDLERRQVLALLPDRETATVERWFAGHPTIEVVSRDRGGGYGEAAARALPEAGQVADRWHLMEPVADWEVMIRDHHEGNIGFETYLRNRSQLGLNAYRRAGGAKSGRGGRALLVGLVSCGRCGRRLGVSYAGRRASRPTYRCDKPNLTLGLPRCIGFGGARVDAAVSGEVVRALEPIAVAAALEARRMLATRHEEVREARRRELQQARYEATLAERRYAACDPENRLIAAQLERNWEAALRRVEALEEALAETPAANAAIDSDHLLGLGERVAVTWDHPDATSRTRQKILRALIVDVIADVDDATREVVLTIHWRGGRHSELRVRKPRTGEHGCATSDDALARHARHGGSLVGRAHRCLAQPGWASRPARARPGRLIVSHRSAACAGIHAYRSADKAGEWLTMREVAAVLGVTSHAVRRLTQCGVLATEQVMSGAPHQIRADDLRSEAV